MSISHEEFFSNGDESDAESFSYGDESDAESFSYGAESAEELFRYGVVEHEPIDDEESDEEQEKVPMFIIDEYGEKRIMGRPDVRLSARDWALRELGKLFDDKEFGSDSDDDDDDDLAIDIPPHLEDYRMDYYMSRQKKRPQDDDHTLPNFVDYVVRPADDEKRAHDEKNARDDGERAGPHSCDEKKAHRGRKRARPHSRDEKKAHRGRKRARPHSSDGKKAHRDRKRARPHSRDGKKNSFSQVILWPTIKVLLVLASSIPFADLTTTDWSGLLVSGLLS